MLSPAVARKSDRDESLPSTMDPSSRPIAVLVDLIGARQLPVSNKECYCVVDYGSKTIHRTKPYSPKVSPAAKLRRAILFNGLLGRASWEKVLEKSLQNPIWSIMEDSLFAFYVSEEDLRTDKLLTITVWARPRDFIITRRAVDAVKTADAAIKRKEKKPDKSQYVGKISIPVGELIKGCISKGTEERQEVQLLDENDKAITSKFVIGSGPNANFGEERSMVAYRCRFASNSDLTFVEGWKVKDMKPLRALYEEADIVHVSKVPMVTELAEYEVQGNMLAATVLHGAKFTKGFAQGAVLTTAAAGSKVAQGAFRTTGVAGTAVVKGTTVVARGTTSMVRQASRFVPETGKKAASKTTSKIKKILQLKKIALKLKQAIEGYGAIKGDIKSPHVNLLQKFNQQIGTVLVKPYPDPSKRETVQFMTRAEIKAETQLPSRKWVQAGSIEAPLGRIHLEILSAHGLPNVDLGGGLVGNLTDAFCNVVYGDSMVQTDVIHDELSPHWLPWTQRAFIMAMRHPSHVLYVSIFGYKRHPMQHRPIGRIQINPINFHHNVVYNLEYELFQSSHGTTRSGRGKIRLRFRVEVNDQRKLLLAALQPPLRVYINMTKKKSLSVARYTVYGEYNDGRKFSLNVLKSFVEEMDVYIRQVVYATQDSLTSLMFWRSQVRICNIGIPLYSMLAFAIGMLTVEYPRLLPANLCFAVALCFLVQMQQRSSYPSPWRRCFSFGHYLSILATGKARTKRTSIKKFEGNAETKALEDVLRQRIEQDKEFLAKQEAIDKEVQEVENEQVETKSDLIPLEILIVLGKVQGIVGEICRAFRAVDAIVTWEYSDLSFLITLGLLMAGLVFLFVPWMLVYRWMGRLMVLVLLGPQNILFDLFWYRLIPTDNQSKLQKLFAKRMFRARCKQEEVLKLRVFRHLLFGKYGTLVPSILWTPHRDFPLPSSMAYDKILDEDEQLNTKDSKLDGGRVSGQKLHGKLIPRPEDPFKRNNDKLKRGKDLEAKDIFNKPRKIEQLVGRSDSQSDFSIRTRPSVTELDLPDLHDFQDTTEVSSASSTADEAFSRRRPTLRRRFFRGRRLQVDV